MNRYFTLVIKSRGIEKEIKSGNCSAFEIAKEMNDGNSVTFSHKSDDCFVYICNTTNDEIKLYEKCIA